MKNYCTNCSGRLRRQARYCSHCGFQVKTESGNEYPEDRSAGYRSLLRDSSYLEPEWRESVEAALRRYESELPSIRRSPLLPGKKGKPRTVWMVMILPALTLGFYSLYWWWKTGHEVRNYLGNHEPSPVRDISLLVSTCGLWRFYMHYNYASQIVEMERRVRLPQSDYLKILCPLLSLFFLGSISFGLMQDHLNRIWRADRYGSR
jgi:hypothetical protein